MNRTRAVFIIVFLMTCCRSSPAPADYIRPTPECAQAQQQLNMLDGSTKQFDQIETNTRNAYDRVKNAVGQIDYRSFYALRNYISNKDQAWQTFQQAQVRSSKVRSQYYQFRDRFNAACYVRTGPPPPLAPPPPPLAPPAPASVRIENVGDRQIYFSVVSRSNGSTKVCDVDAIDSNSAMEPSIFRCSGQPLEMALHNGHELTYYKLTLGSIYQIYWNGNEWRLRFAYRE
jgi:hypothetical protein